MARKSKTQQLLDDIAGQHLALSVAANLARTQLVPDPLKVYDAQHLGEMLNVVALALTRTAALYITDAQTGTPRQLTPAELEGAIPKRSAGSLTLRDGRTLAGVTVKRDDLRQAIAVLKAIGMRELAPHLLAKMEITEPSPPKPASGGNAEELRARFAQLDEWLKPPLIGTHVDRAKAAAIWIARNAPHGHIANLAMQLISALHNSPAALDTPGGYRMALARLGAALQEVKTLD
jgi:hypothetical protein